ncbi:MAG TPA: hypothetical protein VM901_05590 [Bdellovibrionota bacterium]|jgi:hypothetical protein|nr:hypothetical protein [Bdellovibrionota bacterium]
MGLLFSLQPELRLSNPRKLFLQSAKRKFFMGGVLFFGACILGTMYLAATPIFDALWSEGGFWDKAIAGFFRVSVVAYPLFAISCFLYFDNAVLETRDGETFSLYAYRSLVGIRFARRRAEGFRLADLRVHNWKGAVNTAAIEAERSGNTDRYATRGHWILSAPKASGELIDIEKRAKRDEIEWLKSQIELYFSPENPS